MTGGSCPTGNPGYRLAYEGIRHHLLNGHHVEEPRWEAWLNANHLSHCCLHQYRGGARYNLEMFWCGRSRYHRHLLSTSSYHPAILISDQTRSQSVNPLPRFCPSRPCPRVCGKRCVLKACGRLAVGFT